MNQVIPQAEGGLDSSCAIVYNLQAGTMSVIQYMDTFNLVPRRPMNYFTADALSNSGSR